MNPFVIYNKETTRLVHGLPGKRRDFDHKKFATTVPHSPTGLAW
jgi:hypothetical protein